MSFDQFCHIDVVVAIEETLFFSFVDYFFFLLHVNVYYSKKNIHACIFHLKRWMTI